MKYLLIAFMLIGSVQAQTKKDNAVIVHGVTFTDAVNKLLDMNYRVVHIDKDFQTAETAPSSMNEVIFIRVDSKGDLIIRAQFGTNYGLYPVQYFPSGKARWDEMMKFAGQFENREYAKL
jgi:hypothetical protein